MPEDYKLSGIYGSTIEVPFWVYGHTRMDNMIKPLKFDHIDGTGKRSDTEFGQFYKYTIGSYGNGGVAGES